MDSLPHCRMGHGLLFGHRLEMLEPRTFFSSAKSPDVVLQWNEVLIDVLRVDRTLPGPGWASRSGAMMFGAIFDAINSIEDRYEPLVVNAKVRGGTSGAAAAASAAWKVLTSLYPGQKSAIDKALVKSLKAVPDGRSEDRGVALGVYVANQMLKARADDGSRYVTPYDVGTDPGDWQPTAPDFTPAWGPGWGKVTPFSDLKLSSFIPDPPPALDSAEYAASYNEVKSLGEKDSTTRTADQTEIGIFWGYDRTGMGSPMVMFNQWIEVVAKDRRNDLMQNARLFALSNVAMADAGIAAWNSKFLYNLWRPVTAIQNGDVDGNALTEIDPTWEPLGAPGGANANFTPPFPAYVSGHATFGAATAKVLERFYGSDRMRFTLVSDELPGVQRRFTSFSQAAKENGVSRIYLGVHWNFDNTEGQKLGNEVANFVINTELERRRSNYGGSFPNKVEFTTLPETNVETLVKHQVQELV